MARPATLDRDISPPPKRGSASSRPTRRLTQDTGNEKQNHEPSLASIEAGKAEISDHLQYFVRHLSAARRNIIDGLLLSIPDFQQLYLRHQNSGGSHFVIHQHDHPVAGVHYDLRLQFSETSTVSFAIPYGMPGNPNSVRPNRMAIETRVHNQWNNLIETASNKTGSLLIWDTGHYEVLPRSEEQQQMTEDESSDAEDEERARISHPERLIQAFQQRYIRLRLHGTRLPRNYTVALRLTSANNKDRQPKKPQRKRRRMSLSLRTKQASSDDESDIPSHLVDSPEDESAIRDAAVASEDEEENATIRANNAYTGASNTIGSIHQRHWFLTLDKQRSGFRKLDGRWVGDWEPFIVRGRDFERSVVTGRSADEVMADKGVEKFVGRGLWRPIEV